MSAATAWTSSSPPPGRPPRPPPSPGRPAGPPVLTAVRWADYLGSTARRAAALAAVAAVAEHGAVLVTGVPPEPGAVLDVTATFGFVRTTNYGMVFDVRIEPDPDNLAFTDRALAPHTDNPYRDPVPTAQVLHCLRAAGSGGDTVLVDGFAAAADLRATDLDAFVLLSRTPMPFRYSDATTHLAADAPVIRLGATGAVTAVRWNDRSMYPPPLPDDGDQAAVVAVYRALRAFAAVLADDRHRTSLRLAPGDCLIIDNTRFLHGRTAFTSGPDAPVRHLRGCYADLDGLRGTLARLRRA